MYKKGVALEIQFSPERLNDGAGDPYWIDLTAAEAAALLETLQAKLSARETTSAPLVVTLDTPREPQADAAIASPAHAAPADQGLKQWVCVICGWVYDEAAGAPDDGLAPGTRWADVPDDWRCPLCDVGKEDFALVEF
ncbi:Anaerobic nitric oxide reductase flavorubredoxin [Paraburkholderia caffeinitolerans]|uniref:Rubredoxin n=1 Tax=Paraburkholderia caffeinitolerans TaxID=1723730 RepID=A0A6J5G3C9_9BURK|nr:rubredoxin [Paraburkholderia caffeinitolerans]CAB3791285.1 Anaerobic nitric oxide reductase flavorubredoxin [Paraburkholderia caffeinitolerans]